MSITEIEAAIVQLPPEQLDSLISWLEDYRARRWDEQIAADLDAGKLDALLEEVNSEIEAGLSRPL